MKTRRWIATFLVLAGACALSIVASHWAVDRIYSGDLLPSLFTNRQSQPIEHYYQRATTIILAAFTFLGLVTALAFAARLRSARVILIILVTGDVLFCVLSEIYGGPLSIRVDRGVPEWFQYFKEIAIAVTLIRLSRVTGHRIFFVWGCLFAFLFLDDSLRYHEHIGGVLAGVPYLDVLAQRIEVRAVDIAELLGVAPLLLAFFGGLAFFYFRETPVVRRTALVLGALLAALLFFGGVMDLVDRIATTRGSDLVRTLSLIEDGGEMLTMSAILAYTASLFWNARRHFGTASSATDRPAR